MTISDFMKFAVGITLTLTLMQFTIFMLITTLISKTWNSMLMCIMYVFMISVICCEIKMHCSRLIVNHLGSALIQMNDQMTIAFAF